MSAKRTAARGGAALVVIGLALVGGLSLSGGRNPYRADFRRLAAGDGVPGSAAPVTSARPQLERGARVRPAVFTGSVRRLPRVLPDRAGLPEREVPELQPPGQKQPLSSAVQAPQASGAIPSAPAPDPTASFRGLDFAGTLAGVPPDPVGDVGPNQFLQAVNTSIGIFSKTGTQLAAFTFNSLWSAAPTGTPCDSSNRGDPTVVYDPLGDRWIVADFAFSGDSTTPPFYECIAVSKTSDPVGGGWYLYPVRTDDASHPWFADYPKMGIWPDGLYMTANMFQGSTYREVRAWAFNRSDLESGTAVRNVVMDLGTTGYFSLVPGTMHTVTGAPPAGRENLLVSESESLSAFEVWKFHADYSGPGSTFTGPTNVSQANYFSAPQTVPTPGNSLDSLLDRIMMQVQYSKIGSAESLWVNHTVACCGSGTPAGIQWAQINVTGGTVATTPAQQQIYPPATDGLNRWMGSLAVDRKGDMALGYSVANATTNPDIRYAGRLSGDPLGSLPQSETSMLAGVTRGTQSGTCKLKVCTRWGDYSAMTIDPDGCRFWYTQEYYETTGLDWQTRIGSFTFPSCLKADQTISFGAIASKTYGDADFSLNATASSGLPVSFAASGSCTVSGALVHITGAGSCTVTASQAGDATFAPAAAVSQTFAIGKAAQSITFAPVDGKTWGDADFAVSAGASSGLPVVFSAAGSCTVSAATVHITGAGACTLTASQAGDSNYNAAADAAQTIVIVKASQTITFGALADKRYGAPDFTVAASASSGLAVLFSADGICTVSGTTVHLTGSGTCKLTASQPGDSNFEAADDVARFFSVARPPCTGPKVVGKRLPAARSALARRHCRTGKGSYVSSRKTAKGRGHLTEPAARADASGELEGRSSRQQGKTVKRFVNRIINLVIGHGR